MMRYHRGHIAVFTLLLAGGSALAPSVSWAQETHGLNDEYPRLRLSVSAAFDAESGDEEAIFSDDVEDDERHESAGIGGDAATSANAGAAAARASVPVMTSAASSGPSGAAQTHSVADGTRTNGGTAGGASMSLPFSAQQELEQVPQPGQPQARPDVITASITTGADRAGTATAAAMTPPAEDAGATTPAPPAPGFPVAPVRGTEPGEGLRLGVFTLYGEVTESAVHSSNPDGSGQDGQGVRFSPDLRLISNWSRHELAFSVNGNVTAWNRGGLEREGSAGAAWRLDVRRHLRLRLGASHAIAETRIGSNRFQHDTDAALAAEYERGRLRLAALTGVVRHTEPEAKSDDYTAPRMALYGRLRTSPMLGVYGEAGGDVRRHDQKRDASGVSRDSRGAFTEFGLELLRGPILEGRLGVRLAMRDYDQPGVKTLMGAGINGRLTWRPRRSTTAELEALFDLDDDGGRNPAREQTLALSIQQILRRGLDWRGRVEVQGTDVRGGNDRLALKAETSLAWRIHGRLWIVGGYEFEREFEENVRDPEPIHTLHLGLRQRF